MASSHEQIYRPISDYALIGDAHSAALVAKDGSIEWCCWPRFDSPAVLCGLLDSRSGGCFRVAPRESRDVSRSYIDGTNVLSTTFTTRDGQLRVTDFMPMRWHSASRRRVNLQPTHEIFRLVEGLAGHVEVEVYFRPTFDYARVRPTLACGPGGATATSGRESLYLSCPFPLQADPSGALVASASVSAGERIWTVLAYDSGPGVEPPSPRPANGDEELARTLAYWRKWSEKCSYSGPYHDLVRRSALTLKLLTFAPTGALVAAPTTSLPGEIGGVRNWDYRYTWLRDSSLVLNALMGIGYHDEAIDFFDWLESICIGCSDDDVQIMYTIDGGRELPERTLDHLDGYRGSRPVRAGNAASSQTQLDVYGEVLDAVHSCFELMPRPMSPGLWSVLRRLADQAAARWREPDQGIWEVRSRPQHFLYSKLFCWVALDRTVRLAELGNLDGNADHWRKQSETIREAILAEGYDGTFGAFTRAFGDKSLDASALVMPLVGFLPPTDPRVRSTVRRIQERLTSQGLVYRYLTDDGIAGGEATFAICSFWLVDNLALCGQVHEARALFERITGYANDVGLLGEQIEPASGELLGNYPQAFTHLALIRSALHIAKAEARGAERQPTTPGERAATIERRS